MADQTVNDMQGFAGKVLDALADVLRASTAPEELQARQQLLRRLALEGDVFPSRIPAPRNITEVGGYLNLLERLNETAMRTQALAAALGVAGPNPMPGETPVGPVLLDVLRANDRPAGPAQASIPVQLRVRTDFAAPLDAALKVIRDAGCALPILSRVPALPPASPGAAIPGDLLPFLGRTLELAPAAALVDPDADPLAVAHPEGVANLEVVARRLDAGAPQAAAVPTRRWGAFRCDASTCTETVADRTYLPLTPILNAAGWYQPAPTVPVKLAQPGSWARWTNVTGLVAGRSRLGEELYLRFSSAEVAASCLRDAVDRVWDGTAFVA